MGKFVKDDGEYTEITTPICRTSWVFVFKRDPKQKDDDPSVHKMTLMLPKNRKALESLGANPKQVKGILLEVKQFKKEFEAEAQAVAKARFKGKWKTVRWNPMLDGDKDKHGNDGPLAGWEGNSNFWIIRAKTQFQPTVTGKNGPIEVDECPEGIYSGCWVRAKLSLYPFDTDGNKGVAAGLGFFIKKIANDEEFKGSHGNADEAFEDSELDDIDDAEFEDEFEDEEDEFEEDDDGLE